MSPVLPNIRRRVLDALPAPLFGGPAGGPRSRETREAEARALQARLLAGSNQGPVEGGIGEVLARVGQGAFTGLQQTRLDSENRQASANAAELFQNALGGDDNSALIQALGNGDLTNPQSSVLASVLSGRINRQNAAPEFREVGGRLVRVNPDGTTEDVTPGGIEAERDTQVVELGDGSTVLLDRQSGEVIQQISPPTGNQGRNVTAQGQELPDPPREFVYEKDESGFVVVDERGLPKLAPIPGSTAELSRVQEERELAQLDEATRNKIIKAKGNAQRTLAAVDQAIELIEGGGFLNQGGNAVLRQLLKNAPGTTSRDIQAAITRIRANLTFEELQSLRAASENGASGLGQVTNVEINLLGNAEASLDTGQTTGQLLGQLQGVRDVLSRTLNPEPVAPDAAQPPAAQPAIPDQARDISQAIVPPAAANPAAPAVNPLGEPEVEGFSVPGVSPAAAAPQPAPVQDVGPEFQDIGGGVQVRKTRPAFYEFTTPDGRLVPVIATNPQAAVQQFQRQLQSREDTNKVLGSQFRVPQEAPAPQTAPAAPLQPGGQTVINGVTIRRVN